jgi:hypothetical protein
VLSGEHGVSVDACIPDRGDGRDRRLAAPAMAGDVVRKPDLSVWGADGRFQGYSAAQTLDLSSDAEKATFTAKVAGAIDNPTYNFDLNLNQKPDDTRANRRSAWARRGTPARRRCARRWPARSASACCPRPTMCGCRWT